MITPEPPAGSEHYREGWRHGYEQAAIDRERSADAVSLVPATLNSELKVGAVPDTGQVCTGCTSRGAPVCCCERPSPDTGQARADRLAAGIRRFADDCKLLLDYGGLDNRVARSIAQQERNLRALLAEPSGDTVQTPDAADLAYARSEVDKWLASGDPYCILPTRTEHIPALLARLDELEGIV